MRRMRSGLTAQGGTTWQTVPAPACGYPARCPTQDTPSSPGQRAPRPSPSATCSEPLLEPLTNGATKGCQTRYSGQFDDGKTAVSLAGIFRHGTPSLKLHGGEADAVGDCVGTVGHPSSSVGCPEFNINLQPERSMASRHQERTHIVNGPALRVHACKHPPAARKHSTKS